MSLTGAKLVIDKRFHCPDCFDRAEYGPTEGSPPSQRIKRSLHPQEERLFPVVAMGGGSDAA